MEPINISKSESTGTVNQNENNAVESQSKASLPKPFTCNRCSASFSIKISLMRHQKIHTDEFVCKFCNKHFSSKYDLEIRHMYIHTKEMPFKCNHCKKEFKRRSLLNDHICANLTGPVLKCGECCDRFLTDEELTAHAEEHRTKKLEAKKKRKTVPTDLTSKKAKVDHTPTPTENYITEPSQSMEFQQNLANKSSIPENMLIGPVTTNHQSAATPDSVMQTSQGLYSQGVSMANHNMYTDNSALTNNSVVYSQSAIPVTSNIVPISLDLTGVTASNNIFHSDFTGSPYVSNVPYYSNVGSGANIDLNVYPDHQSNNNINNTQENNLLGSINRSVDDSVNVVKNELLNILISGTNLQNSTGFFPGMSSGVSSTSNSNALPTFQSIFAQNTLYRAPTPSEHNSTEGNINQLETKTISQYQDDAHTLTPDANNSKTDDQIPLSPLNASEQFAKRQHRIKQFKCQLCRKAYHNPALLEKHMKIHSNPHVCHICNKKFLAQYHLERHILAHSTDNNIKNNISNDIDDVLKTVSREDFIIEQPEDKEDFESSISDSMEEDSSILSSDNANPSVSNDKVPDICHFCPVCKRSYKTEYHLEKHMIIHNNPFVCTICGKKFLTKEMLENKHMKLHQTEEQNNTQLMMVHSAEQVRSNMAADNDNSTAGKQSFLNETIIKAEKPMFEQISAIGDQSNQSLNSTDLQTPIKTEMSESPVANTPPTTKANKPFQCSICTKSYILECHLQKHMVLHNNPFKCNNCGKTFTTDTFLKIHMKKFHGEELQKLVPPISAIDLDNINLGDYQTDNAMLSEINLSEINPTIMQHLGEDHAKLLSPVSLSELSTVPSQPTSLPSVASFMAQTSSLPIPTSTISSMLTEIQTIISSTPDEAQSLNVPYSVPEPQQAVESIEKKVKPYPCQLCSKKYLLKSNLDTHMKVHTDPSICPICGKKFATPYLLNKLHMPVHNVVDETKPLDTDNTVVPSTPQNTDTQANHLPVPVSNAAMETSSSQSVNSLNTESTIAESHIVKNEPTTTNTLLPQNPAQVSNVELAEVALKNKPFHCQYCSKRYSAKLHLTKHMVIHLNPFVCKICGRKFLSKTALEDKHMAMHKIKTGSSTTELKNTSSPVKSELQEANSRQQSTVTPFPGIEELKHQLKVSINHQQIRNQQLIGQQPADQSLIGQPPVSQTFVSQQLIGHQLTNQPPVSEKLIVQQFTSQPLVGQDLIGQHFSSQPLVGQQLTGQQLTSQPHVGQELIEQQLISQQLTTHPPEQTACHTLQHQTQHFRNQSATEQSLEMDDPQIKNVHISASDDVSPIKKEKVTVKQEFYSEFLEPKSEVESHMCALCPMTFKKQSKRDEHFLNHSKRYACLKCNKSFKKKEDLEEDHIEPTNCSMWNKPLSAEAVKDDKTQTILEVSTKNGVLYIKVTYDCSSCERQYKCPRFLKKHLITHTDKFACTLCDKKFSSKFLLESRHMLCHHPDSGLFKCSYCRKTYTFMKNLDKHLESHKVPVKCKLCIYECNTTDDIMNHHLMHSKRQISPNMTSDNKAEQADSTLKSPSTLQYFASAVVLTNPIGNKDQIDLGQKLAELTLLKLEQEEDNEQLPVSKSNTPLTTNSDIVWLDCPLCDKRYSQKQYLDRHMVVHTNPFVCKICGKAFASSYALEAKHMLIHSAVKPYKCTMCDHTFKELRRLRDHVNKHHMHITPHVCSKCNFRFQEENELLEHMKIHEKQKFKCGDCLKICTSQGSLNEHMKCHTGQQHLACEQCGNHFVYQSMFDKHLLYTEKENFQCVCPPCSQSFSDSVQFYVIGLVYERKSLSDKNEQVKHKMDIREADLLNSEKRTDSLSTKLYEDNSRLYETMNMAVEKHTHFYNTANLESSLLYQTLSKTSEKPIHANNEQIDSSSDQAMQETVDCVDNMDYPMASLKDRESISLEGSQIATDILGISSISDENNVQTVFSYSQPVSQSDCGNSVTELTTLSSPVDMTTSSIINDTLLNQNMEIDMRDSGASPVDMTTSSIVNDTPVTQNMELDTRDSGPVDMTTSLIVNETQVTQNMESDISESGTLVDDQSAIQIDAQILLPQNSNTGMEESCESSSQTKALELTSDSTDKTNNKEQSLPYTDCVSTKSDEPLSESLQSQSKSCDLTANKCDSDFSFLKSALSKPTVLKPEPVQNHFDNSKISQLAKDFKTFTDIMIEQLVSEDGVNK